MGKVVDYLKSEKGQKLSCKVLKYIIAVALIVVSFCVLSIVYQLYIHWEDIPWEKIVDAPHKKALFFYRLTMALVMFVAAGIAFRFCGKHSDNSRKQWEKFQDAGVDVVKPSKQFKIKSIICMVGFCLLVASSSLAEFFGCGVVAVDFFKLLADEMVLPIWVFVCAVVWYWDKLIVQAANDLECYLDDDLDVRDAVNKINNRLGYRHYEVSSHNKLTNMRKVIHHG